MDVARGPVAARSKWQAPGAGARYRGERWGERRRARVDPRIVGELVRRHGVASGTVLDVGCGTGRLRAALTAGGARWVGLDASLAMLREASASGTADSMSESSPRSGDRSGPRRERDDGVARGEDAQAIAGRRGEIASWGAPSPHAGGAVLLAGDALALPFRDGAFDAVVACRLLHHFRTREALAGAVAELVRVSRRIAIASFWDAGSLPALRRRMGLARDEGPAGRVAWSKTVVAEVAREACARVVEFRHVWRYVSQQTFAVLAVERAGVPSSRER